MRLVIYSYPDNISLNIIRYNMVIYSSSFRFCVAGRQVNGFYQLLKKITNNKYNDDTLR